jgi:hypothetical protein
MSNSNRVSLNATDKMTAEDVSKLPLDHLEMLQDDLTAMEALAKARKEKLSSALDMRFGESASAARQKAGKDTGSVTLIVEGKKIKGDLKKNVKWMQPEMIAAIEVVKGWGTDEKPTNLAEYVKATYEVAESKFNAWPSELKAVFEPARIVSCGKPTYEFAGEA